MCQREDNSNTNVYKERQLKHELVKGESTQTLIFKREDNSNNNMEKVR